MLTSDVSLPGGVTACEIGAEADHLYFLVEGSVDLYFVVGDPAEPESRREFFITAVNPGEPFGISGVVEPYIYTATVKTSEPSRILKMEAAGLRALCELDPRMSCYLMRQVAKAALVRLQYTQVQLAAARA